MKIVIIGLGTIGKTILKNLSGEGHTVTIIDEDKNCIENLIEKYDVMGVVGNGASMDIQNEAGVAEAQLVIALTRSDELNILACLVAKKVGAENTIARVRNPAYRKQIVDMKDDLGISMVVNPERETADEIFNIVNLPSVAQIEHFAEGKVSLVEVVAEKGCSLIGETLISLGQKLTTKVLICAVQRGDEVIIPSGRFEIREGDRIHFTSNAKMLGDRKMSVISGCRAKEFHFVQFTPRGAAHYTVRHRTGHRIIHNSQAGIATNDHILRLYTHQISHQLLCLRDSVQTAVIADIHSICCLHGTVRI